MCVPYTRSIKTVYLLSLYYYYYYTNICQRCQGYPLFTYMITLLNVLHIQLFLDNRTMNNPSIHPSSCSSVHHNLIYQEVCLFTSNIFFLWEWRLPGFDRKSSRHPCCSSPPPPPNSHTHSEITRSNWKDIWIIIRPMY